MGDQSFGGIQTGFYYRLPIKSGGIRIGQANCNHFMNLPLQTEIRTAVWPTALCIDNSPGKGQQQKNLKNLFHTVKKLLFPTERP